LALTAYLLAAAVGDISVSATGYTGSIGVVLRHVDMSRLLANDGITVTQIYAGAAKVDGNPYEPLSAGARERFQADVDAIYEQFVPAVATYRGLENPRRNLLALIACMRVPDRPVLAIHRRP